MRQTWQTRARLNGSAATVAMTIAMISGAAHAQSATSAGAEAVETETIVVTGSLIRNPALERSSPVTVTSAADIELRQNTNAESILREIPGIVPSIGSAVNNGNGGASFVNLRGLGSNRNLVLIDGNRLVPAELNGRFDLNNIPVALLENVQVLTGGASTTYGADAVSGVVNFVTKRDFSGVEFSPGIGVTQRGDGQNFRADLTIGANFDDGRGNVVLSVGYNNVEPVSQGEREFSRFGYFTANGAAGGSGTSAPSRFSGVNPTGVDSITGVNAVQGTRQITLDGTAFRPTAAFDPFNFNPYNVFQVPFERFNIYSAGRYEINEHFEVYARGIFSKNTVKTIIAPSGAFGLTVNVPLSNPFLSAAQRNAFCQFDTTPGPGYTPRFTPAECAAAATATSPTDPNYREVATVLARRAVEGGPRISEYDTTFFDYRAGVRGAITSNIDYDFSASYGQSENRSTAQGYYLNSRVRQAVRATSTTACLDPSNGCVPANFFGPIGAITPAMNAFLYQDSTTLNNFELSQVRLNISGDAGFGIPMASNPIAFAIGAEYRSYSASQSSDLLAQSGDLGGAGGAAPNIRGAFNVKEIYGELIVPLVQDRPFFEDLTLEGGARYSSYNVNAPGSPSFDTFTWKAGGSWTPGAGVKVRGSYARAVRAPNIAELFSPVSTGLTNLGDDPCASLTDAGLPIPGRPIPTGELRAICIAQGAPAGVIGSIQVPTAGQANTTGGGNPNVKPETSNSWTLGAVWTPTFAPGLSFTVDYYNIKVKGAISNPTPGDAITACFGPNPLSPPAGASTTEACTQIRRSTLTGQLSGDSNEVPGLFLALTNLGRYETDGIDFTANYATNFGDVRWAISAVGNWTNKNVFQAGPDDDNPLDCVGLYSPNCTSVQPSWQWSVRNTFTIKDIDISLLWRHISSTSFEGGGAFKGKLTGGNLNGREEDFNTISAYNIFDLSFRAAVGENLTLTFAVLNLFDKDPELVGSEGSTTAYGSGNVLPSTYDALGRRFQIGARLKF
jgi:outer membrane receptor protein involved in Fe transport